jgi:CRP/FNR family cyclic AMP-dependent transcriptional regulator
VEQAVVDKLKQISLFQKINENDEYMAELEAICRPKSVSGGQVVIKEGEKGSEMYIMLTGAVEIQRKTRAGDSYTVLKLRAEQNIFFGEMALIDDDVRSATIVATEDSEFLFITKEDFFNLGERYPQIALPIIRVIAQILASRLRNTTGDMLTIFDALVNELQQ